ncbi:MAG: hypothetical protein HQL15_03905 [Candidatus Omnitrophica bacterium]|nr:hypothetical protein [Candidatus Omnitrophota bacterium]
MQRIGLAASKIAKGNIWFYHLAVVLISLLFAAFVFLVCGFIIVVAVFLVSLVVQRFSQPDSPHDWFKVLRICLKLLVILMGVFTLAAILKNIKLRFKI